MSPPSKGGKKLWIVIVAVIVVALLIGSSVYVMFLTPIKAKMLPAADELSVDAGKVLTVSVSVKKGLSNVTGDEDIKYLWTVIPNNLGSWQKRAESTVNLTAGKAAGTGKVTCKITYKGEEITLEKPLRVKPPYLDQVIVSPSKKTLDRGKTQVFTASAVNSVADPIVGLTYTWTMTGDVTGTLNVTTGQSVLFTAGETYGNVTLTATATYSGVTKSGNAAITIGPLPPRKVDYYWYDMFNVPFNQWWDMRAVIGKEEIPLTHEYPYLFKWVGFPAGNTYIYTNMRLNITGRNMSEINMNERPEFLPLHGNARGGTAVIDWYLQYLTSDEMKRFPDATSAWADGWVVSLNGTVTLDEQAALSVILGLTSEGFQNFDSWWSLHKTEVKNDFGDWFKYEAGKDRLDIFPAYDYAFTTLAWDLKAQKVGDKIVLTYDLVTWGAEMLLSMWMREAFMPTEWYFEDMNFHATIGPEWTKLDADTAVAYAVYAYEATNIAGEPCWVWEALVQDYVETTPPENRESLYNKYADKTYLNTAPGSLWYGKEMTYDYTPGAWNLSENETLTLTWPAGEQTFLVHKGPGQVSNYTDTMRVNYSEPMMSDASALVPGSVVIDNTSRYIKFVGPIDMWHWSKTQTNPEHWWLSSEWERLGLLPYGAPYIEFNPSKFVPEPAKLAVEVPDLVVMGDTVDMKVTCLDQFDRVAKTYEGTVTFSTNRTGEVSFPADYTFTLSDEGVATIHGLSFSGLGWFNISVRDKDNESIKPGWTTNVYVVEFPEVIDHFTVVVPGVNGKVMPGMMNDVQVRAHNQYQNRTFRGYTGTITFSTNATEGTYSLPENFTFTPAMKGYAVVPNLVFLVGGAYYSLTVSDTVVTTAQGSTVVYVEPLNPKIDYRLYDMFQEPWHEWWPYRLIGWKTDIILSNESGKYTMVYNPDKMGLQGIIMAPYRWNVSAVNMSTVNVNSPAIMPVFGPEVPGASAHVDVYFQYLSYDWWNNYWRAVWGKNKNWSTAIDSLYNSSKMDGYYLGTVYTVRMNREAAESWLNMPQSANPLTWWNASGDDYMIEWQRWITRQGNIEFDIYAGYEWAYVDMATMMDLKVDGDDVVLSIGHLNWGYEVLITRWMTNRAICTHEPYFEDFQLSAQFEPAYGNLTYDAVAQYNLHAVKANKTASDAAWVWEPLHIDYIGYPGSEFNPWELSQYTSWNSGDALFGDYVSYDATPCYFNLASYMTLTIQAPTGDDTIGYRGLPGEFISPTNNWIRKLKDGDDSNYKRISVLGEVWLGYHVYPDVPGAPDLSPMWNNNTKVLFLQGPMTFQNYLQPNDTGVMLLYHSAPWIEFNISNKTWPGATLTATSLPSSGGVETTVESASSGSMNAAMTALAIALMLSIVATVAVVGEMRPRD